MKKSELKQLIREEIRSCITGKPSRYKLSQDLGFDYTPGQAKKLPTITVVVNKKTGASYPVDFIQSDQIPLELDTNGKYLRKWKPQSFQRLLKAAVSQMYSNTSTSSNYITLTKGMKESFAKEMTPIVKSLQQKFKSWLDYSWMQHITRAAENERTSSTYPKIQLVMKTPEYKKMIGIRKAYKAQLKKIIAKKQR